MTFVNPMRITHTCNHVETHTVHEGIAGSRYVSREQSRMCSRCKRYLQARLDAGETTTRDEETLRLLETHNVTMPALVGSQKQVEWARKIRKVAILGLLDCIRIYTGRISAEDTCKVLQLFAGQPKAAFWIDNRDYTYLDALTGTRRLAGLLTQNQGDATL